MKARKLPPAGPRDVGLNDNPLELHRTAMGTHRGCPACGGTGFGDGGRFCGRCQGTGMLRGDTIGRENSKARVEERQRRRVGKSPAKGGAGEGHR